MAKKKILVVEDEDDILELVTYNLVREGYQVEGVRTGEDALASVNRYTPDLIVLDLMLPGVDGMEVCRQIRSNHKLQNVPLVMLTAKSEESDIVSGLELGADDYVTKPFSPKVFLARVRAVLRRRSRQQDDERSVLQIHDLIIHPGRHEVRVFEDKIDLTSTEFKILHFLARRPGWVFTRKQIVDAVHGMNYPVTDRSIDFQIVGLRKKLGDAGSNIETIRGVGYRFRE
ncbi:MAG TPA: response regulator transcription factor [Candidatus Glassbacteria bacterium]|nr:response regulator transcription factor [Candidatus Glassbacteria bacterium]